MNTDESSRENISNVRLLTRNEVRTERERRRLRREHTGAGTSFHVRASPRPGLGGLHANAMHLGLRLLPAGGRVSRYEDRPPRLQEGKAGTTSTTAVSPDARIQSANCEDWWWGHLGRGPDLLEDAHAALVQRDLRDRQLRPRQRPGGGTVPDALVSTFYGTKGVKRTRSEIQVLLVNPVASTSPWTAWSKD